MSNQDRNMEVAQTLLHQMGGKRRLAIMTGANTFIALSEQEGGVSFKIKNRKGPNFVKIILTSADLYEVEFGRIWGTSYKVRANYEGVFADQLKTLFEHETGMYLSF